MKKNNIVMLIICMILICVIVLLYNKAFLSEGVIIKSNSKVASSNKMLAIMYETKPESGEYVASDETSWLQTNYIFNETLSKCENGSSISYDGTNVKVLASKSDRCYVYFDREVITLANYIKRLYVAENEGQNGIYLHDGDGTYTNGDLETGDGSYRYAGASDSVNNYICLGSTETTCPDENTFRIIGVFNDQVKVIKNTTYGDYAWSGSSENTSNLWADSTLNTEVLNGTYLNSSSFVSLIDEPVDGWQVGGNGWSNLMGFNAKHVYEYEIKNPKESIISNNKVGLMYMSDYMYGASPTYWSYVSNGTETTDYRAATSSNWLYLGSPEWTITPHNGASSVYNVIGSGCLNSYNPNNTNSTRPCFYLLDSVKYSSGNGTLISPYTILLTN